jgi:hypothetical protein
MVDAASASINSSPIIMSPFCGEIRGELVSVLPADGCIIAAFGCTCSECGGRKIVEVALPGELAPELRPMAGKIAGVMRSGEKYLVQDFSGRSSQ